MSRPRHPNKAIEEAIRYAEGHNWTVEVGGSHAWGFIKCPTRRRGACYRPVWSTPKDPVAHANDLKRLVDRCNCAERPEG